MPAGFSPAHATHVTHTSHASPPRRRDKRAPPGEGAAGAELRSNATQATRARALLGPGPTTAGTPFRFGGERRLHKEQIVATHARKHAKILPSFGPHGCVKPYCCLSGLIRVLALVRKKLQ